MKKLILKSFIFVVLGFIVLNVTGIFFISDKGLANTLTWRKVLTVVTKCKQLDPEKTKVIVLGDSVANQFFNRVSNPNSLAANGSALVAGHFMLAYHAIKRCPNLKYIVLACIPLTIGHPFERSQTYNNFMKPFYTFENLPLVSRRLREKINKKKWAHLVLFPFVKTAPCFSDVNFNGPIEENRGKALSDLSVEYLKKLYRLCKKNDIELVLVSPPVKQSHRKSNWKKMRAQIKKEKLGHIFKGYFQSVIYLEHRYFRDSVHMKNSYLKKYRINNIRRIIPKKVRRHLSEL